ncbi:YwpF-like family protein [Macrococcus armenti]|uniref:YwpF-like family protein n=1 Tax=Macrococcus armenti TaxID=2875764 RepID=UPI001CCFF92B|nr:YwpF-like family protein [Macrococcus armenti]UBH08384.1 YwpF-like family protein [Macrococcus armenti]UBH10671.1 YwpF-like family protein [Macrococcus armenti]UBH15152.1 YwpF-like family protein [Macrococcus armenti]UBH17513.1 YwpF-like family protein [Macrococcus armenti]UBH19777.1 YwpF-like family protein [Macrococcus armenti]
MKTFKAIRFQIVEDESMKEYMLYDGVIINKENSGTGWLLEILIDEIHLETMESYMQNGTILDTRVVITRASNDPAMFEATIKDIQVLGEKISVIFECHIYTLRQTYAEKLLEQLVNDGLSGQSLITAFNRKMQSKPKLKDENE